jgi:predicted transglutaminase-like cysteine proteinase
MTQHIEHVSVMVSITKATNKPLNRGHRHMAVGAGIVMACLAALTGQPATAAGRAPSSAFLPAGRQIAAPTAFLEMCARSPVDCERTARPDDAHIVILARQAMVAKYEQAFAHNSEPTPGAISERNQSLLSGRLHSIDTYASVVPAPSDYTRIDADRDTLSLLKAVNRTVNHDMIADTDADVYHVNDYWDAPALTPGARGDCEDFALVKRRLLIAQGIPAAAISLAIVKTRFNEDHAVLVVSTTQGDVVLDNLAYGIKYWWKTGYSWISRQAPGDNLGWISFTTPLGGQTSTPHADMQVAAIR